MSASAVFDKLCLRSAEDLLNLSKILIEQLKAVIQANGETIDPNRQVTLKLTADEALKDMDKLLAVADNDLGFGTPSGGHLKSPMLPPLSPLQKDDEVVALEAEVEATSKRVAELRVKMQAQVQEQLTAKLAAHRPSADISPPRASTADHEPSEGEAGAMSPAASELRNRLVEAAGKMPELLARLEETKSRLNKVLDAATAPRDTHNRPPPNTVERAVLGAHDDYDDDDDDDEEYEEEQAQQQGGPNTEGTAAVAGEPPVLKEALQSGLVSTRVRGGRAVEPVTFPGAGLDEDFGTGAAAAEEEKK